MSPVHLFEAEKQFWGDEQIVRYFGAKEADPRVAERLAEIENPTGMKALDLGCGGGRHTELLLRMGFEAYGCDPIPEMVRETRRRVADLAGDRNLEEMVREGSITGIPFEDEAFGAVVSTGVLHQAKSQAEYREAAHELARVMAPGAVLAMNVFTNRDWDPTYQGVEGEPYTVITREGLWMTLLPKQDLYEVLAAAGIELEKELVEEVRMENTGPRTVLRANFVKRRTK